MSPHRVSPDSARILSARYLAHPAPESASIATDGSDQRELITEGSSAWPALSPDGTTLAFASTRGDRDGDLARRRGRHAMRGSCRSSPMRRSSCFARDGRSLYFTSSMQGAPATYRLSIEGEIRLSSHHCSARPSPDGRQLGGLYRENARTGTSLGILTTETGTPVKVFQNSQRPRSAALPIGCRTAWPSCTRQPSALTCGGAALRGRAGTRDELLDLGLIGSPCHRTDGPSSCAAVPRFATRSSSRGSGRSFEAMPRAHSR